VLVFSPVFLRGYVMRLIQDVSTALPVMDLDMHCPLWLSGAPVIREDRWEAIGVVFQEQTTMAGGTITFGRALHLDLLRVARGAATGGRALVDHLRR
jgi:hypothetical protein